jgi:hypothetical protein
MGAVLIGTLAVFDVIRDMDCPPGGARYTSRLDATDRRRICIDQSEVIAVFRS